MSKRRTRPGGVMARATKRSGSQRRLHAVLDETLPVGLGGRERALAPDQQAGLLIGLADRRKRDGARPCAGSCARWSRAAWLLRAGQASSATGTRPSSGSVRPPGKTNLPGMKAWLRMAPAHQHAHFAALAVEQDQRRGVARPHRAGAERSVAATRPCRPGLGQSVHAGSLGQSAAGRNCPSGSSIAPAASFRRPDACRRGRLRRRSRACRAPIAGRRRRP